MNERLVPIQGGELSPPLHQRSNHEIVIWHSDPIENHMNELQTTPLGVLARTLEWSYLRCDCHYKFDHEACPVCLGLKPHTRPLHNDSCRRRFIHKSEDCERHDSCEGEFETEAHGHGGKCAFEAALSPDAPKCDPMEGHRCTKIASAPFMAADRDWWLGVLARDIPGYPLETHCLHLTTPAKSVVFGVMQGDTQALAIFAAVLQGSPINEDWQTAMMERYQEAVK